MSSPGPADRSAAPGSRALLRWAGLAALVVGAGVVAVTTGRGAPWLVGADEVDANALIARGVGWAVLVVGGLAGCWLTAWVGLAAVGRSLPGRLAVTVVYVLPPALLALDAFGTDTLAGLALLVVLWPVPLLLLWTGRRRTAARAAAGLSALGLAAHAVLVTRVLLGAGTPAGTRPGADLWSATGGQLLVLLGALCLLAATGDHATAGATGRGRRRDDPVGRPAA